MTGAPTPSPEASGVRPHVLRSGLPPTSANPLFVLLHGFGASSFTWRSWLPALEERGHVACVDLLGFGDAPKPPSGRYDPVAQSRYVMDALDTLGPGPRTLIGHSLGGGIALLTALALQERGEPAARLVVVAGAAYPQRMPPFVKIARRPRLGRLALRTIGARTVVRQVLRSIVFDSSAVTDEWVEGYARPLEAPAAVTALLQCAREIQPPDLDEITNRYPDLRTPTLLLWGRYDRVVPTWIGERLARDLAHTRLRIVERCGHVPHEERPGISWAEVASFLDS